MLQDIINFKLNDSPLHLKENIFSSISHKSRPHHYLKSFKQMSLSDIKNIQHILTFSKPPEPRNQRPDPSHPVTNFNRSCPHNI